MSDVIRMSRDGAVAAITIDRPAEGNVLTTDMLRALTATIRAAAASDAKVIALRSTGADFCRGRDGKGGPTNPTALVMRDQVLQPILDVYDALNGAPQPVVCAVQGAAYGFGCATAAACDVTIAADVAKFRLPEMSHDLPPTLAISALMPKVPRKALAYMVYAMPELDAATALQLGIVSAVVPVRRARCQGRRRAQDHDRALARGAHRRERLSAQRPDDGAARRRGLWRGAPLRCAHVGGPQVIAALRCCPLLKPVTCSQ